MAALSVERVDKHFGATHAVDCVSLTFEAGRIHAVVGENGAGKSSLLRIAAGIVAPDSGEVRVAGEILRPHTAREAIRRGVGMVQQHFALVGALTALENVMLGAEPVRALRLGRLDFDAARARATSAAADIGVSLPWDAPVRDLGVGDRQRLEIVRTLVREARVVILDEPTAVLTPGEATELYATLRRLADGGRAVVVVTHHLDEVRLHADEVSVLRGGRLVASRTMSHRDDATLQAIVRDVMGGDPPPSAVARSRPRGEVRLELRDVRRSRDLRGVTLSVCAGEIVGVAGVEGNGQRELVRVIAGLEVPDGGELRANSVAVVHEDRQADGLALDASVRDNLVLGELASFTRLGIVDARAVDREAWSRLDHGHIVPRDLNAPARSLSGGNQQRLVVARALARAERVSALVLAQPTRGADLGAAHAIRADIARAADDGKAVLVVSTDLPELKGLCDRILVMARGRVVAELPPDASDARFGEAMLGGSPGGGAA